MCRSRKRVALWVLAMTLLVSACAGEFTLADFLGPEKELSQGNAGEVAAGDSAYAIEKINEADESIDQALDSDEPAEQKELVEDAIEARKRDSRYHIYQAFVQALQGDIDGSFDSLDTSKGLWNENNKGLSERDRERKYTEQSIDVSHDLFLSLPTDDPGRENVRGFYCDALQDYANKHANTFEGQLYLGLADLGLCPELSKP